MPRPRTGAPLAQHALHIYDSKNEAQMIQFISEHLDQHPNTNTPQQGCIILGDHSVIITTKTNYTFAWSGDGTAQTQARRRDPHRSPEPPVSQPRPSTMFTWPNDQTVLQRALLSEQQDCCGQLDHPPPSLDPDAETSLLTTGQIYQTLPHIAKLLQNILAEPLTESLFNEFEERESQASTDLLNRITDEERQTLRKILTERIQNLQPEASEWDRKPQTTC